MRILIADDDPTSRLVLKAMVTKLGHECLVAEDGSSAWELLSSGGIDVLLTDWMMPGSTAPSCAGASGTKSERPLHLHRADHRARPPRARPRGHGRRRRRLPDQAGRPVRGADPSGRSRAGHRPAPPAGAHPGRARESQPRAAGAVAHRPADRARQPPSHGGGPRPHPRPRAAVGRTYGVALFDIDHFKLYNDHYGHVAGDEALRRVAAGIDFVVRAGECAYRYGGEEFLLLMPDCDPSDCIFVSADRSAVRFSTPPSPTMPGPRHLRSSR